MIGENYERVMHTIAGACAASGRRMEDVTLVAVTKFVPEERIQPLLELGVTHVGENRAQEFRDKLPFFEAYGCTRHFIGQLQTNKVKYVVGHAALVQSVDRMELAEAISHQAKRLQVKQDILIEVNIGGEAQKGGVNTGVLPSFLEEAAKLENLRIQGLMCIPPAVEAEAARPYFAKMRGLFQECAKLPGVHMRHLSMGMSGDYAVAIEEGATMVRIGSALFGPRQI